jgi:hypothetical protein
VILDGMRALAPRLALAAVAAAALLALATRLFDRDLAALVVVFAPGLAAVAVTAATPRSRHEVFAVTATTTGILLAGLWLGVPREAATSSPVPSPSSPRP